MSAGWELFLVETLTGRVGPKLPASAEGSWTDTINAATQVEATVPTPWLLRQDRIWWSRWAGSILACHDGEPIVLGPITDEPSGNPEFTTLTGGGLWSLLEKRIVTPGDHTDGSRLAKASVTYTEGSLGTIARRIVEDCQDRPQGWFPISYGSPVEEGSTRTRTYKGFNLGNNNVAKRLQEISEVINGPDIAFRPRWRQRDAVVEWVMFHGTEGLPEIANSHLYVVDLTAPRAGVAVVDVKAGSDGVQRCYATGEGQDEAMVIVVESTRQLGRGVPFLEDVEADTQTANPALLSSRAKARLGVSRTVQVSAELGIRDEMPLHTWWAGDEFEVQFPAGWTQLDAGVYRMRCIQRSGDFTSGTVKVEYQPEGI